MSTIEIGFKASGSHNHIIRDVPAVDIPGYRHTWKTGKGRVIALGPILYARDAIAWVKFTG